MAHILCFLWDVPSALQISKSSTYKFSNMCNSLFFSLLFKYILRDADKNYMKLKHVRLVTSLTNNKGKKRKGFHTEKLSFG